EHRQCNHLVDKPSHDHREMTAEAAIIAPAVMRMSIAHVNEYIGIVTHDVLGQFWRVAVATPIKAFNVQLNVSAISRRGVPANALHDSLAHHFIVAGLDELAGVAFEDDNVLRLDAGAIQVPHDFEQEFGARDGTLAAFRSACLVADRIDLDTDNIPRLEETTPGSGGIVGS